MKANVSLFTAPTSASTITVPYGDGAGETSPAKAIIVISTFQTGLDGVTGGSQRCFGMSDGTSDRSITTFARDGLTAATISGRRHTAGKIVRLVLPSFAPINDAVTASVSSVDTAGSVSVNYDLVDGSAYQSAMLVLSGSDVSAKIVDFGSPASGSQSVTGVGFKPDGLIIVGTSGTTLPSFNEVSERWTLGAVSGDLAQMSVSTFNRSGRVPSSSDRTGRVMSSLSAIYTSWFTTDPFEESRVTSMDADGFTLNWLTTDEDRFYSALCVKGAFLSVQKITSLSSVGEQDISFSRAPRAFMSLSTRNTVLEAVQQNSNLSIGVGDMDSEATFWQGSKGAASPTVAKKDVTNSAVLQHRDVEGNVINQASLKFLGKTTILDWTQASTAYDSIVVGFMGPVPSRVFISELTKDEVLIVYRDGDTDSKDVADHYVAAHGLGSDQLAAIPCTSTEVLADEAAFNRQVLDPIKSIIESADRTIVAVVLGYNIPGGFFGSPNIVSSVSRVSRMFHGFNEKTRNYLYDRSDFKRFDSNDADFAYVVSRIDAPTVAIAKKMIDNAQLLLKQKTTRGKFYIDPYGGIDSELGRGYENEILDFQVRTLPTMNLDTFSTVFLDPYIDVVIPSVENDSFIWSWFADRSSLSFFNETNSLRVFAYNADFDGAATIKDIAERRWPVLSIASNYLSTAGAMSNPTIDGLLRPRPFFESIQNGATLGEAFLFSTPFVDWTMTFFGDPLVAFDFPAPPSVVPGTDEKESWRLISTELAKALAYLYRNEDALERTRDLIVFSTDILTEVDLLLPSVALYDATTLDVINSDAKPVTNAFFSYIDERFRFENVDNTYPSVDDYLTEQGVRLSDLIIDNTFPLRQFSVQNVFSQGYWEFDFILEDDAMRFVFYYFELEIFQDSSFSDLLMLIDSEADPTNWFYEKDVDEFVPIPAGGVPSSFSSRRIRYASKDSEFLARTAKFYPRVRQKAGGEVFEFRIFPEQIVYT